MFRISFHRSVSLQTCSTPGRVLLLIHVESNWADESPEEAFETAAWRIQGETPPSLKSSGQRCPKAGVGEREAAGAVNSIVFCGQDQGA